MMRLITTRFVLKNLFKVSLLSLIFCGCNGNAEDKDAYIFSSVANPRERFEVPVQKSVQLEDFLDFDEKCLYEDSLKLFQELKATMGYREYQYQDKCIFNNIGNHRILVKLDARPRSFHYMVLDTIRQTGTIYNIALEAWNGRRLINLRFQPLIPDSIKSNIQYYVSSEKLFLKMEAEYSRPVFFELGGFKQEYVGNQKFTLKGCVECSYNVSTLSEVITAEKKNAKSEGREYHDIRSKWQRSLNR